MSDRPEDKFVDETLDEHSGCMKLVSEVEECLDRRPNDPPSWVSELREKLMRLDGALARHFEGEEAGPIFRSLPTRHPRLAQPLAALEAEHAVMLEELRAVLDRAKTLEQSRGLRATRAERPCTAVRGAGPAPRGGRERAGDSGVLGRGRRGGLGAVGAPPHTRGVVSCRARRAR